MHDIENYRLGETDKVLQLEKRAENISVANHMANQCQRTLNIISRELDPLVFDTDEFADAVKYLALRHRRAKIQIIVFEPDTIIKRGHRLLDILGRLSSFIEIRKAHYSFSGFNECLMVADATGYIHRENGERFEGTANFKDLRLSKNLLIQFAEMWEQAAPDPNFRNMLM
jgi:hypothetical protein